MRLLLLELVLLGDLVFVVHGCASPIVQDDSHVFDELFFNLTDDGGDNETETLTSTATPELTTQVAATTTPTTTTTGVASILPPLFAIPSFLRLDKSRWMPFGKHADYVPRLLSHPTWRVRCSPPVSWTFCFPQCGSGDQALDGENAQETAQIDAAAAVNHALQRLRLGSVLEEQVRVSRFSPRNCMLEDFGPYYDRKGIRFRMVRGSVRYFYSKEAPGEMKEYLTEIDITLDSSLAFTESLWKSVGSEIASYLTHEKYAYIPAPPTLISYSASGHSMFLF